MQLDNEHSIYQGKSFIVREIAVGIAASLLFFTSVLLIPMMGIFAGVFTPLPTLLGFYKWGFPLGLWIPGGTILASWLLLFQLSATQSIPYLVEMLLLGVAIGAAMRRNWSLEATIGAGSLFVFLLGFVTFWLSSSGTEGLLQSLENGLRETIALTLREYGGDSVEMRALEESLSKMVPLVVRILPGASLASAMVMAWLNVLVTKRYCLLRRIPLPAWGDWSEWKAMEQLVWIVIAAGFGVLLPFGTLKILALNVLIILGTVYLFQGLAIIAFYFERWKLPKALRALFYGFLLLQQFASLGAALLGLFDVWFDFRRLSRKSPSGP